MPSIKSRKRRKTVVLVDDEPNWLHIMTRVLENESYRVLTAEGAEAALSLLESRKPDLIISDVRMPAVNGFDFFEKVKHNPKLAEVPFVFMSTIDDFDAKNVARQLGADAYVVKPMDVDDVRSIVSNLLTRFDGSS